MVSGGAVKRSVLIAGHRTSVSLEPEFWDALKQIAASRNHSINGLITEIDRDRSTNLSSALRVFVLNAMRARNAPNKPDDPSPAGDD